MSDILKCPFCQQELEEDIVYSGRVFVSCNNPNCIISDWGGCSKQIITEFIRTRKALELAITGLKNCKTRDHIGAICRIPEYVDKVLEQISTITKGCKNE